MNRPKSLYGAQAAVASGHHLATRAAEQALADGGTLVDAMVAASAVLTVVLPHASSLGGCGMVVYFDAAEGRLHALNGTGRSPLAATLQALGPRLPQRGPRAWVTPTLVRMWARAHERFGRLAWSRLLQPALALADAGTAVPEELARNAAASAASVRSQPGFAEAFLRDGQPVKAGDTMRQPALAAVLSAIADQGEQGFYDGTVAERLLAFSAATGGLLQADDLRAAQADWVTPWSCDHAGRQVHVMPPNSVGVLMLSQLQRHTARHLGQPVPPALATAQAVLEAARLIAQYKDIVADPLSHPTTPADFGLAGDGSEAIAAGHAAPRVEPGDTTGFVAMDRDGNALAMLQSVFQPFGSGCVDPGTGVLMNNRLFDFSTDASRPNALRPGRRPSHTLNPYLVTRDGRATMAGVSPGGVSQTTTGYQIVSAALAEGATLGELVTRPRWSLSRDGEALLEPGVPPETAQALRDAGMAVVPDSDHEFYFGSVKAVRLTAAGWLEAAADGRRQAHAAAW